MRHDNITKMIEEIAKLVKEKFLDENTGHDWEHTKRVWENAKEIGRTEKNIDMDIVELGALLHDVADWKQTKDELQQNSNLPEKWMKMIGVDTTKIAKVIEIISNVSYKGNNYIEKELSVEGKIVKDADRLDAMGVVGWERTIQFGKAKNRPVINNCLPELDIGEEEYMNLNREGNTSINHVFEKLLLLKNKLLTKRGRELGEVKHNELKVVVREYLNGTLGKNLVPDDRVKLYLSMLDEARFN